jgi:hypothetical protein
MRVTSGGFRNGKEAPPLFFVSADSKELAGERLGSADSEGVRRTAWRGAWLPGHGRTVPTQGNHYNRLVPYLNDYLQVVFLV